MELFRQPPYKMAVIGAISSEVEHYLDTVGVTGSIPVSPIKPMKLIKKSTNVFLLFFLTEWISSDQMLDEA